MDIGVLAAQVLVSVVAVITVVGGVLADVVVPVTAHQHLRNPNWSPHAKFHNGQTIWLGALTGGLALVLVWLAGDRDDLFHLAVVVTALVWLSMLGAALIPGTRWVDPEFDRRDRRFGPPQLRLAVALLVLLGLAEVLRFS